MNGELDDAVHPLESRQGRRDAAVIAGAVQRNAHAEVAVPPFDRVQGVLEDGEGGLERQAVPEICAHSIIGHGQQVVQEPFPDSPCQNCASVRDRLRARPEGPLQRTNVRVEGGDRGCLRRDQPGGEREGPHGRAPVALALLEGATRTVVIEPGFNVPAAPGRQRPDRSEGGERRDERARGPARSGAGVAPAEIEDHRAAKGRDAVVQGRHALGNEDRGPRERRGRGQRDGQPPKARPARGATGRPARGAELETSAPAGRGRRADSRRGPYQRPRFGAPGCAGGPP